ncbi:MAG: glycoside hydrolase family 2 TIM barrel-domain containing protein [Marinilabiliaceae bacterium]|jgi:hypothetical protein|nr:glycoside hydrolase family 2 TIM barrel-domain containing protein [Marinilabiliaceae bacterium]
MHKPLPVVLITAFLFCFSFSSAQDIRSLAGKWQVNLEADSASTDNNKTLYNNQGIISLPGSLAENAYGYKTTGSDFGVLTPEYKYTGKASYSRDLKIPEEWAEKELEIFLERVLWESRVFIDDMELSRQDALGTPHIHKLGKLKPGTHKLVIVVDNNMIHNIGDKGHAYGEYTQSIWNGITGRMEIQAYDPVRFTSVKTFPDLAEEELKLKVKVNSNTDTKGRIHIEVVTLSGLRILSENIKIKLTAGYNDISFAVPVNGKLIKWSEFTPETYILKASLRVGNLSDTFETEFGYYEVSHNGTKILINGHPVFLRGNLDCVHFPLTGYPSCKLEDWLQIFDIYRDYGLNHVRFHSWCPPEAAFRAANRKGIYIQAEASIWIDWWMSVDNTERGRPEMNTKGFPKGLGKDPERDAFVVEEMNRVIDTYGNHPSFIMFCIGNELGNSDFDIMKEWVKDLKDRDPGRLYSVSTARTITEVDDYISTHYIQGLGSTRGLNGAGTDWDFEKVYSKMDIPVIAHEIGQWPVYPQWSEIEKYTGVLKARNLEEFREVAKKNGIAAQDHDFALASGALNQLMYKYETESFFRTASCAGVQLLSMQDYQGQGEALIGWLDAHWESKGISVPGKFREHYNTTVPLLRIKKFVWSNNEDFRAGVQVSHHGPAPIEAECKWTVVNEIGELKHSGSFGRKRFMPGELKDLGEIGIRLGFIDTAQRLKISVELQDTEFRNDWNIWVYPEKLPAIDTRNVLIRDKFDSETLEALQKGARVLLLAHNLGTDKSSVKAHFYPLYWSLTFFPGQGKTCIGLLADNKNPAYNNFPTSFHSDWQWESISSDARAFILNQTPDEFKPIAQPIDDFHRNNKLGSIFEFAVGNGKLLVCGYNIESDLPVAKQLRYSLLQYMNSRDFNPAVQADSSWLKDIFTFIPDARPADIPEEYNRGILIVDAAAKLVEDESSVRWNKDLDSIIISKDCTYSLIADGAWKDKEGHSWHGKSMQLSIECPEGMLGTLYVKFHDWNNNGRSGILEFEGRKQKLGRHDGEGAWIKFHIMREDSNDGRLILKAHADTGPNLMITNLVLIKE